MRIVSKPKPLVRQFRLSCGARIRNRLCYAKCGKLCAIYKCSQYKLLNRVFPSASRCIYRNFPRSPSLMTIISNGCAVFCERVSVYAKCAFVHLLMLCTCTHVLLILMLKRLNTMAGWGFHNQTWPAHTHTHT